MVWVKYGREHDSSTMSVKNSYSSFWKCMVKIWLNVVDNCLWYVGDGANVDAWNDLWITNDIKIVYLDILIPMQLHAARVRDLVKKNEDWDQDSLVTQLSEDIRDKIASMLPPSDDARPDDIDGIRKHYKKFYVSIM